MSTVDPATPGSTSGNLSPTARFRKLEDMFHRASELDGKERNDYLLHACADDQALLNELRQMLGLEAGAEARIDAAVGSGLDDWTHRDMPSRVGPYRILGLLGEGGLGAVYLAERDDEHFHKRVAIKWVRPEMGSDELDRRFRIERQILAALEHPNIARILDGGTHDRAAFIVMELVDGCHLLDYCRQNAPSTREKLNLFRKICDAVHYAHQNLILHCDLKPSNILVDTHGTPKLVDFGIAKALRGSLPTHVGDSGAMTSPGARPLTPDYASPEQAQYRPLTTSSDIYSLGVVLYELLSGERPYRIDTTNPIDIADRIADAETPAPSLRWRERHRTGGKGSAPWGPDLDAIVVKALRKEPEQRYRSVEQLSEDLRRYLDHRPVVARHGSWLYPWKKLVFRHRWAVATGAAVISALASATAITSHQARVAEEEKERAEAVVELLQGLFEVSDPSFAHGSDISAREMLDRGSRQIQKQLDADPELRAPLALTIGGAFRNLTALDQAEMHLSDSLASYRSFLPADAPEIVESLHHLALLRLDQDRAEEADRLVSEALGLESRARGSAGSTYGRLLQTQALCRLSQGLSGQARQILERFLGQTPTSDSGDGIARADAWDLLAQVAYDEGTYAEAETFALRGLEGRRRLLEPDDPKIAVSLNNLAAIHQRQGNLDSAHDALRETLDIRLKVYGERHEAVAAGRQNLAAILVAQRKLDDAEAQLDEALDILLQVFGPEHTAVADLLFTRAQLEIRRGNRGEASKIHRRALDIRRRKLRPGHPQVVSSLTELAYSLSRSDAEQAESLYQDALTLQRGHGAPDSRLALTLERLGNLLCDRGATEQSLPLLKEALDIRRNLTPDDWRRFRAEAYLGRCLGNSRPVEAIALLRRAIAGLDAAGLGPQQPAGQAARQWLEDLLGHGSSDAG